MKTTAKSLLLSGFLALAAIGAAAAQSPETLAAADRLIAAQDLGEMMKAMVAGFADALPEEKNKAVMDAITDPVLIEKMKAAMRVSMAKHFTLEEIDALADFYSQPVAKSAMAKMGPYMADVMPQIQAALVDVIQRMQLPPQ